MASKLAWIFGIVLTLVGVLGFVMTSADGLLLGIFKVDALHNLIHLVTGVLALLVAWSMGSYMNLYFRVFGVVYAVVAVVGFLQGDTVLGLITTNMADHVLHLALAAVFLWAGFAMKEESTSMGMNSGMSSTM